MQPAVGVEDGAVEFVVEFAENADESGLVDGAGFLGEFRSRAQGFEDVGPRRGRVVLSHRKREIHFVETTFAARPKVFRLPVADLRHHGWLLATKFWKSVSKRIR